MSYKDQNALRLQFGLEDDVIRTPKEMEEDYGITRATAWARKNNALKKLKTRISYKPGFLVNPDTEKAFIEKYFEYHDIFEDEKPVELNEIAKRELQNILGGKEAETDNENLAETSDYNSEVISAEEEEKRKIELKDLCLSGRSYNALSRNYRHHLETVGDIINLEEKNFREIRNLGQKSAEEVIEIIHSLGLRMKWEKDEEERAEKDIVTADEKTKTGLLTIELGLSVRSYNCLARAGFDNVDDILDLEEKNFRKIRNLGPKSVDEVIEKIHSFGLNMKWEEEKTNTDADLKASIQQLKTAYSNLKDKEEESEELKRQLQEKMESAKYNETNSIEKSESSEETIINADGPSYDEL